MSKLANQWIDLFRAGDYSAADKGVFTDADVDQIVANYDPQFHEAPIGFGHLNSDEDAADTTKPAYGWIEGLRRVGDLLQGKVKQVQPAFEEAVESGAFKKRSVELLKDAKGWQLRRVAFLGYQPPQVKGLADIQFEQQDKDAVRIVFQEEVMAEPNEAVIENGVIKALKKMFGASADTPARTYTEAEMKQFAEAAAKDAATAAVQAAVEPLKAEFAEAQRKAATSTTKQRAADAIAKLKAEGKWVPAFDRMGLPIVFEELATITTTVQFGEADATTKKVPEVAPLDVAVAFFGELKKIVPNDAVWKGEPANAAADTKDINTRGRAPVDANSALLDQKVRAHMGEAKCDYGTALTAMIAKHPELAKPGGASVGAA